LIALFRSARLTFFNSILALGSIARITIPRSQGKQAYYDARKANWGDAFPHAPRITPLVRTRGIRRLGPVPTQSSADGSNVESSSPEQDNGRNQGAEYALGEENRTSAFEMDSEAEMARPRTKGKDKLKRKGLREARRQASSHLGMDTEDWINSEASELATRIQARMQQELAERQEKIDL
jgi:hypothetical protein